MEKRESSFRKCLAWYSLLFLLLTGFVGFWFAREHVTFVVSGDGYNQHYKALLYYSRYLRRVLKTVFVDHSLRIPTWDFTIGEGSDIFQALQYYVIGDPFAALSVFVPSRLIYVFYHAAILLRLWCAGTAFMALCFCRKCKNLFAVLAGALTYTFCYWCLLNLCRHPYFLNPLIYLPLIVLGLEKLFRGERPYAYILAVWIAALSNFYFFYQIVLTTVVYVLVRLPFVYRRDWKRAFGMLVRIALLSVLATAMAAVIFIPICRTFLADSRMNLGYRMLWHYGRSYYRTLPVLFLGVGTRSWLCLGFAAPALPAVLLLWLKGRDRFFLKALFLVCLAVIFCPALSQIFNGFSYVANRWCWSFVLLVSFIVTEEWPELLRTSRREKALLAALCLLWLLYCGWAGGWAPEKLCGPAIALVFMLLCFGAGAGRPAGRGLQAALLLCAVISIAGNIFWEFSPWGTHRTEHMKSVPALLEVLDNDNIRSVRYAAEKEGDKSLFRFSGANLDYNVNLVGGLSSTQYYWTISNPNAFAFRERLQLIENIAYNYRHYDNRAALESLAAVKYYLSKSEKGIPFGFTRVSGEDAEKETGYLVFRNDYALPLCYTYDRVIRREDWEAMDAAARQEALLQGILLEGCEDAAETVSLQSSQVRPDFTVEYGEGAEALENGVKITGEEGKIKLKFRGEPGCETYLSLQNLRLESGSITQSAYLTANSSRGIRNTLTYYMNGYRLYCGRHDFLLHMGYDEKTVNSISLTLDGPGTYTWSELAVICLPMDSYGERIEALRQDTVEEMAFGVNSFSVHVENPQPKWLCAAIPWSEGWSARVDGQEVPLYRANEQYMGLRLEAGSHDVLLTYRTPLFGLGAGVSLLAGGLFVLYIIVLERRLRRGEK